ncbi:MAG: prefoldin subunit alpha [Candidatus Helarchaeota archaeon]|nr:prefoldin subunit alpha [Candidatus Helarchaeota archaeon]
MNNFPAEDQQQINRLIGASKKLETQAEQIQMQLEFIGQTIATLQITEETIENLDKLQDGQDFLLPLGNFAYLKAKIVDTSKVLVNVGASLVLEKTIAKAKEDFEQQLEDLNKIQIQLRQAMQQVMQQMQEIRSEIERLAAKFQEGAPQSPVGS